MMPKIVNELIVLERSNGYLKNKKPKPTECIGGVLAKDPSKVKSANERSLRIL